MKALIMAADGFEDMEFFYPYYRLREDGIEVDIAAPKLGTIIGKHGYTYDVRRTIADCKAEDYDILVIPGGKAPETVRLDDHAVAITREMFQSDKVVAAICHGAQLLVSADVLQGKNVTCWKGIRDDVRAAGARFVDKEVVVDRNLVTSRCPEDLAAFMRETLGAVRKMERLVTVI
jgi:protease I